MSSRRQLPSITETAQQSTSRAPGVPLVEDQIRDYRRAAHARYEAQRVGRNFARMFYSCEHGIIIILICNNGNHVYHMYFFIDLIIMLIVDGL